MGVVLDLGGRGADCSADVAGGSAGRECARAVKVGSTSRHQCIGSLLCQNSGMNSAS